MIKFVETEALLPLRSTVLRDGKPLDQCVFAGDDDPDTFHLADIRDDQPVCIASFHLKSHPDFAGKAYQLRGMATSAKFRGRGAGKQLLGFAIEHLRSLHIDYLWCNARTAACPFYLSMGFELISPEFEIEGIGPHRAMKLDVRY